MERSTELSEIVLSFYQAMEAADEGYVSSFFAHEEGALAIGSDPNEWIAGYDAITRVVGAQFREMKGIQIKPGNVEAYSAGNTGWAADRFGLQFPNGLTLPFRVTMTFHNQADGWKAVQMHMSLGVPNEDAIGFALTTA